MARRPSNVGLDDAGPTGCYTVRVEATGMCGARRRAGTPTAFASATADDPGTLLGAARGLATPDQVSYAPHGKVRPDRVRIHDPMRCALVIAIVAVAMPVRADPAPSIHGTVVDRASGKPVAGAIVTVAGELAASDDDGRFAVALPAGATSSRSARRGWSRSAVRSVRASTIC